MPSGEGAIFSQTLLPPCLVQWALQRLTKEALAIGLWYGTRALCVWFTGGRLGLNPGQANQDPSNGSGSRSLSPFCGVAIQDRKELIY